MHHLILLFCGCFLLLGSDIGAKKSVNVYSWVYSLPQTLLQDFEEETGIFVNYDVYDSPEVMETKLLAGSSGYDVVMVTVWPYFVRQREADLYQPLDRSLLSNWSLMDPHLLTRLEEVDPQNRFVVPLLWGTSGFAFNKTLIQERLPNAPLQSLAMLFNPEVVSHLAECGILLLDSPRDVFPTALSYLGIDPNSESVEDLKAASHLLQKIRPFVRKFQAIPSLDDLTSGNYCLVEGFSGELLHAQRIGKQQGLDIHYVIPQEGGALWVDAFALPKDAPHVREAHMFINFLLRPQNIAKITMAIQTANSVPTSRAFLPNSIKNNPLIFPPKEIFNRLYTDKSHAPSYERLRLREWTRVKIGR